MRKILFWGVLILTSLALNAADRPVVKIGAVIPVSGNNSYLGETARNALLMRLGEISDESRFEYKLLIEDDGYEPKRSAMAVRKLRNIDKVDTLISMWGTGSEIAVPLLKGSKVLHMACDRWVPREFDYAYDFTYGSHQDLYADAVVEACEAMGVKRIALFGTHATGIKAVMDSLRRRLEGSEVEIVSEDFVNITDRDFRTIIMRMRGLQPDLLVSCCDMPVAELFLKQMQEVGCHLPLFGISAGFLNADRVYTQGYVTVLPAPANEAFQKRFEELYGYFPTYPAGQFYDTLDLLIDAYESTSGEGKPSVEDVCARLPEVGRSYEGVLGKCSFIEPNRIDSPANYYLFEPDGMRVVGLEELVKIYKEKR